MVPQDDESRLVHYVPVPEDKVIDLATGRVRRVKGKPQESIPLEDIPPSKSPQEATNGEKTHSNGKAKDDFHVPATNHRKCLRGEKLYLTEERKLCQGWKRVLVCGLIVIILAVGLLVGVLAATGILLAESENKTVRYESSGHLLPNTASVSQAGHSFKTRPSSNVPQKFLPSITADLPPNATLVMPGAFDTVNQAPSTVTPKVPVSNDTLHSQTRVPNALVGEFTIIDENFTDDLNDNTSMGYISLATHFENELSRIFKRNGGKIEALKILHFKPGSIIVKFVVIWKSGNEINRGIILAKKAQELMKSYLTNRNNFLLAFTVNSSSLNFIDVFDECHIQNGGCSYECMWDYATLSKLCICEHDKELQADGKTCSPKTITKTSKENLPVTTAYNVVATSPESKTSINHETLIHYDSTMAPTSIIEKDVTFSALETISSPEDEKNISEISITTISNTFKEIFHITQSLPTSSENIINNENFTSSLMSIVFNEATTKPNDENFDITTVIPHFIDEKISDVTTMMPIISNITSLNESLEFNSVKAVTTMKTEIENFQNFTNNLLLNTTNKENASFDFNNTYSPLDVTSLEKNSEIFTPPFNPQAENMTISLVATETPTIVRINNTGENALLSNVTDFSHNLFDGNNSFYNETITLDEITTSIFDSTLNDLITNNEASLTPNPNNDLGKESINFENGSTLATILKNLNETSEISTTNFQKNGVTTTSIPLESLVFNSTTQNNLLNVTNLSNSNEFLNNLSSLETTTIPYTEQVFTNKISYLTELTASSNERFSEINTESFENITSISSDNSSLSLTTLKTLVSLNFNDSFTEATVIDFEVTNMSTEFSIQKHSNRTPEFRFLNNNTDFNENDTFTLPSEFTTNLEDNSTVTSPFSTEVLITNDPLTTTPTSVDVSEDIYLPDITTSAPLDLDVSNKTNYSFTTLHINLNNDSTNNEITTESLLSTTKDRSDLNNKDNFSEIITNDNMTTLSTYLNDSYITETSVTMQHDNSMPTIINTVLVDNSTITTLIASNNSSVKLTTEMVIPETTTISNEFHNNPFEAEEIENITNSFTPFEDNMTEISSDYPFVDNVTEISSTAHSLEDKIVSTTANSLLTITTENNTEILTHLEITTAQYGNNSELTTLQSQTNEMINLTNTESTENATIIDWTIDNTTNFVNVSSFNSTIDNFNNDLTININMSEYNFTFFYQNENSTNLDYLELWNATLNETSTNATIGIQCLEDQFLCESLNKCLNNSLLCDGIEDCPENFDEIDCKDTCLSNYMCANSSVCIMSQANCDGVWDCEDGDDEKNCTPTECAKHEVMCLDGSRCIKPGDICDWKYDCKDRSDEVGCVERTTCESGGRFFCNDGLCIPWSLKCDGDYDCKDKEDEGNCTCMHDEFKCNDGKCLKSSTRCDGHQDCHDAADEMDCVRVDKQGIVMTYEPYSGTWALLCADDWNLDDGHYLCQEFGYGHALGVENYHVGFNGTWMAMRRDNLTSTSLWTERVSFAENCPNNMAAAVKCQNFPCGNYTGILHRRKRQTVSSSSTNQWPFIGYVSTYKSSKGCLSEILTPIWLITSAECLLSIEKEPFIGSNWYVRTNLAQDTEDDETQNHEVLKILTHPHSSKFRSLILRDYDIALIRLKHALFFNDKIGAICLPEEQVRSGITCFSGIYGTEKPRALPPHVLSINSIAIMVMEREACNGPEHYNSQVNQRMLCTKSSDGQNICDNDGGTPLMCLSEPNKWYLAGMLSYQRFCGIYNWHPFVFSNLFSMRHFIDKVIGQNNYLMPYNSEEYILLPPTTPSPTEAEMTTNEMIASTLEYGKIIEMNTTITETKFSESDFNVTLAPEITHFDNATYTGAIATTLVDNMPYDMINASDILSDLPEEPREDTLEESKEELNKSLEYLITAKSHFEDNITSKMFSNTTESYDFNSTIISHDHLITTEFPFTTIEDKSLIDSNIRTNATTSTISDFDTTTEMTLFLSTLALTNETNATTISSDFIEETITTSSYILTSELENMAIEEVYLTTQNPLTSTVRNPNSTLSYINDANLNLLTANNDTNDFDIGKNLTNEAIINISDAMIADDVNFKSAINESEYFARRLNLNESLVDPFDKANITNIADNPTTINDSTLSALTESILNSTSKLDEFLDITTIENIPLLANQHDTTTLTSIENMTLSDNQQTKMPKILLNRSNEESLYTIEPDLESITTNSSDEMHLNDTIILENENNIKYDIVCGTWTKNSSSLDEWPALGYLQMTSDPRICAASIISARFVLTSLSCLLFRDNILDPHNWLFFSGFSEFSYNYTVRNIFPHPNRSIPHLFAENDFALVLLEESLNETNYTDNVCLPQSDNETNLECFTVGWNKNYLGILPRKGFLSFEANITSNEACNRTDNYNGTLPNSFVCINSNGTDLHPCQMDVGAPLFCLGNEEKWEIWGLLSFPSVCDIKPLAAFSSVESVRHWIVNSIAQNE